jgi:TPR repeat protein
MAQFGTCMFTKGHHSFIHTGPLWIAFVFVTCSFVRDSTAGLAESQASRLRADAECGDLDAQFRLGVMYEHGDGVVKNLTEAIKWYERAAQAGNAKAQNNLGYLFHVGRGVPKDDIRADMWLQLATHGQPSIRSMLCRYYIEMFMSRRQIDEAHRLSEHWSLLEHPSVKSSSTEPCLRDNADSIRNCPCRLRR